MEARQTSPIFSGRNLAEKKRHSDRLNHEAELIKRGGHFVAEGGVLVEVGKKDAKKRRTELHYTASRLIKWLPSLVKMTMIELPPGQEYVVSPPQGGSWTVDKTIIKHAQIHLQDILDIFYTAVKKKRTKKDVPESLKGKYVVVELSGPLKDFAVAVMKEGAAFYTNQPDTAKFFTDFSTFLGTLPYAPNTLVTSLLSLHAYFSEGLRSQTFFRQTGTKSTGEGTTRGTGLYVVGVGDPFYTLLTANVAYVKVDNYGEKEKIANTENITPVMILARGKDKHGNVQISQAVNEAKQVVSYSIYVQAWTVIKTLFYISAKAKAEIRARLASDGALRQKMIETSAYLIQFKNTVTTVARKEEKKEKDRAKRDADRKAGIKRATKSTSKALNTVWGMGTSKESEATVRRGRRRGRGQVVVETISGGPAPSAFAQAQQ